MSNETIPFNPNLATLPVYVPGRPIDEVAREHGLDPASVIKLASNENPLGPSPLAVAAMSEALRSLHLYPDGSAFHLKNRLAAHLGVDPAQVILGNGSNEVLEFVGHAVMRPGDEVVVSQHCFAVYPIVNALFGSRLVTVPARPDFGADIDAMLAAITPRTTAVFLANPNNPTGNLATREEVCRLVDGVPARVLLVLDEAYVEFLDEPFDSVALIRDGSRPNLLVARTFSKVYGLAGLRLGYGVASREVVAAMEKVRQPFNINAVAQAGAIAALGDTAHLEATRANNRAGLALLQSAFARMGLRFVPSHANFVLVDVGDGARVSAALQQRGVIVRPMGGYGLGAWIRVTVGTPPENQRFLEALGQVRGGA